MKAVQFSSLLKVDNRTDNIPSSVPTQVLVVFKKLMQVQIWLGTFSVISHFRFIDYRVRYSQKPQLEPSLTKQVFEPLIFIKRHKTISKAPEP